MRAGWQALTDEERQLLLSLPVEEAAKRFGVGTATVVRWRRAIRNTTERDALQEPDRTGRPHLRVERNGPEARVLSDSPYQAVVLSDLHLPWADPDAMLLAREIVRDVDPDLLVVNGDLLDVWALTKWPVSPPTRSFASELQRVREQVAALATWAPGRPWIWLDGNHELRFVRYLWRRASELWEIDDLDLAHLVRAPSSWIHLSHVEGYGRRSEAVIPQVRLGRLTVLHGDGLRLSGATVNVARSVYLRVLKPVLVGHWHRAQVYTQTDYEGQTSGAWVVPCLTGPRAHYDAGRLMDQGLAVVEVHEGGLFTVHLVHFVLHGDRLVAIHGGKRYERILGAARWW